MPRLLMIDVPFAGEKGGDKNRSKFIWETLSDNYESDLLIVNSAKALDISAHKGCKYLYTLESKQNYFWKSDNIYSFGCRELEAFDRILRKEKYDVIFCRSIAMGELARRASQTLPWTKVIIDTDMILSKLAEMSWQTHPCLKNRYYFIERYKLRTYEKNLFQEPYLFLFCNPIEREAIASQNRYPKPGTQYGFLPNFLDIPYLIEKKNQPGKKYILFFGTLNSAANEDAFKFTIKDIYPSIRHELEKQGVDLCVAGKNPTVLFTDIQNNPEYSHIKVLGEVDDMNQVIQDSLFVFLPIRIGTGTRTRILESGALSKAVISTPIGVEGLELDSEDIQVSDDPKQLVRWILEYLTKPETANILGKQLKERCVSLYEKSRLADKMLALIEQYQPRGLKVAIITNRFHPEVGGVETNLNFQAQEISKHCSLDVLCPKRIDRPSVEERDGFTVRRFYDVLNPFQHFPNLKAKTLCPGLVWGFLWRDYDVVQCFPSINHNNYLSFLVCRWRKIPFIFTSFDFLDYGEIIKQNGFIPLDILDKYPIKKREASFLRKVSHIFAISNKEISLFKKYNTEVEYSPVPILLDEYQSEVESPRSRYEIGEDEFVFLALGRVSNIKGQDIALKAYQKALSRINGKSRLVIVGRYDYEPTFYESMQDFIQRHQLAGKVLFTGMVERSEVLGWLRFCDIHVIPVRFMNSGAVVVETWASRRPVIQSDVVDPNLVITGQNGYLFKSESEDDLAEHMVQAWQERDRFSDMAEAGYQLVLEKYTYDYLIQLYLQTYKKVVMQEKCSETSVC